jgi:predicted nucleic acid-binding protein
VTRALYDVNVVLDVLVARDPFVRDSKAALQLTVEGTVIGLVAAHTVTTLHYLIGRQLGRNTAETAISELLTMFEIAPVDEDRLRHAIAFGWADFEDAVQAACAEAANAEYLVTRNKRDFKKAHLDVITPAEFVALVGR